MVSPRDATDATHNAYASSSNTDPARGHLATTVLYVPKYSCLLDPLEPTIWTASSMLRVRPVTAPDQQGVQHMLGNHDVRVITHARERRCDGGLARAMPSCDPARSRRPPTAAMPNGSSDCGDVKQGGQGSQRAEAGSRDTGGAEAARDGQQRPACAVPAAIRRPRLSLRASTTAVSGDA